MKTTRTLCIYTILILPLLLAASCGRNISGPYHFKVSVSDASASIGDRGALSQGLRKLLPENDERAVLMADIVIYNYSSGKEIFRFTDKSKDDVEILPGKGVMESVVKIKRGGKTELVMFFKSEGDSRGEIISGMAREIRTSLNIK